MSTRTALRNGAILAGGVVERLLGSKSRSRQVVVLHDIENEKRSALRECLGWLLGRYRIVPLADLVDERVELDDRPRLALTLDDGYADWHEVAAPVLEDLQCPATFFVSSGFVGLGPSDARAFRLERLGRSDDLAPLSVGQLRDLADGDLFEIGSHTASHADFSANPTPDELASEIAGDRMRLEDWTGRPVRWFAYPWGRRRHLVPTAVEYVRHAGFEAAFTALPGTLDRAPDRFLLPRQSLDVLSRSSLWNARLSGGYDLVDAANRRVFGAS